MRIYSTMTSANETSANTIEKTRQALSRRRIVLVGWVAVSMVFTLSCQPEISTFTGTTMGTTYTIRTTNPPDSLGAPGLATVPGAVEKRLDELEAIFSTYRDDSEIQRIHTGLHASGFPANLSDDMRRVLDLAEAIRTASDGNFAYDLGALVSLWGFGPGKPSGSIDTARTALAQDCRLKTNLRWIPETGRIARSSHPCQKHKDLSPRLDLSGIAKGYAVDETAQILTSLGLTSFMLEIGGEVCTATDPDSRKKSWKIGIKNPAQPEKIQKILHLTNACIATSGNGHQSFTHQGRTFTHILNPRTGMPIERTPSSVTVASSTNAEADAWATALYVLGSEAGRILADREGIAALWLDGEAGSTETASATWKDWFTDGGLQK